MKGEKRVNGVWYSVRSISGVYHLCNCLDCTQNRRNIHDHSKVWRVSFRTDGHGGRHWRDCEAPDNDLYRQDNPGMTCWIAQIAGGCVHQPPAMYQKSLSEELRPREVSVRLFHLYTVHDGKHITVFNADAGPDTVTVYVDYYAEAAIVWQREENHISFHRSIVPHI